MPLPLPLPDAAEAGANPRYGTKTGEELARPLLPPPREKWQSKGLNYKWQFEIPT
jgi:hypothetical protein